MNIRKALEKVIEWQAAASQLKPYLPAGDRVLTSWFKSLQEFKKDLPVLHKLANDTLKVRGWYGLVVLHKLANDALKVRGWYGLVDLRGDCDRVLSAVE